jgi:tetratricopeptide (TPR) repeat protein
VINLQRRLATLRLARITNIGDNRLVSPGHSEALAMGIVGDLSALAVRQLVDGACQAIHFKAGSEVVDRLTAFLHKHFTDHSRKLTGALNKANARAWQALELSLAGDSWWARCQVLLAAAEARAFKQQVDVFLDKLPLTEVANKAEVREQCRGELQQARKAGVLTGGSLNPQELADRAGAFARFAEPQQLFEAEWQALDQVAGELAAAGYPNLAWLVALRPREGMSLLLTAVRYFFRREVETDQELFQGLAFTQMENLGQAQEEGFAALHAALDAHGERLEELLRDVRVVVEETHADVLDIKAEVERQGHQLRQFGDAVMQALEQHQLARRPLRPSDSLSIRGESERQLVKMLVTRYRALPEEQRQQLPALLHAIAKLEVAAGDFDAAQRDFTEVAALASSAEAQAEAHYNAYQTALERRQWPEALEALQKAVQLDPERFAPFPLSKYEPQRILGAGGFGVAFLCRHRNLDSPVVIKVLRLDDLERDVVDVFREARVLEEVSHPAIIRLRDCDYAGAGKGRPFLVMDYFDGQSLAEYVERRGPLLPDEVLLVARPVAAGLHAAHQRGILHRDVKPANLLVRHEPTGGWQAKLIDFGLALKQNAIYASVRTPGSGLRSAVGSSVAGTLDYAAPEQLGRLPGVTAGPTSDVYGFAKTCCFALFGTTQPLSRHWERVPRPLARLLEQCLEEMPEKRPGDFAVVQQRLDRILEATAPVVEAASDSGLIVAPADEELADVLPTDEKEVPTVEAVEAAPAPRSSAGRKPLGNAARGVALHLVFPGDQYFVDASVDVYLDGKFVGKGTILKGFDLGAETGPGKHDLELVMLLRSKKYHLKLPRAGSYEVRLHYDKVWANFTERLDVQYLG